MAAYQTVSVNQTPGNGTDYPFADPPAEVKHLLGDLFLSYVDDACQLVLPFRVVWLASFGSVENFNDSLYADDHDRDLVILDADDAVVFDSTVAPEFQEFTWGSGELRVLTWRNGRNVLRLTRHTLAPDGSDLVAATNRYISTDAVLDPRTYVRLPPQVTSLRVGLDTLEPPDNDNVVLQSGYNIRLQVADTTAADGGRRIRQVRIRARGGDGMGLVPACQDTDLVIKRINAVSPTAAGDFTLAANGCYRVQRPVSVVASRPRTVSYGAGAALQLYNDCAPCCDCDSFIRTYEGIRRVWNKYLLLGDRAEEVRDQYAVNIDRWNAQKSCREALAPRLILIGEPNCRVFVGGSFCNITSGCLGPVVLRLTFQTFNDSAPIDCGALGGVRVKCRESKQNSSDSGGGEEVCDVIGEFPVYDIWFDNVAPQSTVSFKTRFIFDCCNDNGLDTLQATLSVHSASPTDPTTGQTLSYPGSEPVLTPTLEDLWTTYPEPYPCRMLTTKTTTYGPTEGCRDC